MYQPINHANSNLSIKESTPNYSKNKAATNPYQHQKEMPNPLLNITLRLPKQIIKERIEEEKKNQTMVETLNWKKLRRWR